MQNWKIILAGAMALAAVPASASAARGVATADVNMRAGPDTDFPVVTTIPDHARLNIHGCLSNASWCDVTWAGNRGWVSSHYLAYFYNNRYVFLPDYFATVNVPVVTFSFGPYWQRHYAGRSWYDRRSRWADVWRSRGGDADNSWRDRRRNSQRGDTDGRSNDSVSVDRSNGRDDSSRDRRRVRSEGNAGANVTVRQNGAEARGQAGVRYQGQAEVSGQNRAAQQNRARHQNPAAQVQGSAQGGAAMRARASAPVPQVKLKAAPDAAVTISSEQPQ